MPTLSEQMQELQSACRNLGLAIFNVYRPTLEKLCMVKPDPDNSDTGVMRMCWPWSHHWLILADRAIQNPECPDSEVRLQCERCGKRKQTANEAIPPWKHPHMTYPRRAPVDLMSEAARKWNPPEHEHITAREWRRSGTRRLGNSVKEGEV